MMDTYYTPKLSQTLVLPWQGSSLEVLPPEAPAEAGLARSTHLKNSARVAIAALTGPAAAALPPLAAAAAASSPPAAPG